MRAMNRRAARIATRIAIGAALLWAAPAAGDGDALLEAACVARHVQAWPEVSALARERAAARLDAAGWSLLRREVSQAFDPGRLQAALARTPGLVRDDAAALVRGFRDSGAVGLLGPERGYAVTALRDFPGFASGVSAGAIPPTRLALIARVDESSGYARNAWRSSAAVARAFARGARALDCAGGAGWGAPLSARETGGLPELAPRFRERVHVELLFDARDRSGAELQRALRFLESEPARAFHRRLERALRASLDAAMRDLGERLTAEAAHRCAR
jgi:hypothetical protein